MEILKVNWVQYNARAIIGIIVAKDTITGNINVYTGVGQGDSEEDDIMFILKHGQKSSLEYRKEFLNF